MAEQKQTANNPQQKTVQKEEQKTKHPQNDTRTLLVRGYFVDERGQIRPQQSTGDYVSDVFRLMSFNPTPKKIVIAGRGLAIAVACEVANKCHEIGMLKLVETKISQANGDQRQTSQIEIVMTPTMIKNNEVK